MELLPGATGAAARNSVWVDLCLLRSLWLREANDVEIRAPTVMSEGLDLGPWPNTFKLCDLGKSFKLSVPLFPNR